MSKGSAVGSKVPSIVALLSILIMVAVAVVGLCIGLSESEMEKEPVQDYEAVDVGDGSLSLAPDIEDDLEYYDGENNLELGPSE